MNERPYISITSAVYNAEKIVPELVRQIEVNVKSITDNYEIILVDDGSTDRSWEAISSVCKENPKVKGIKLSRNFGQHYAISACLEAASGEFVVLMDCDLQDNPKYIPQLLDTAVNGYDIVYTVKDKRKHSFLKNLAANIFYSVFNYLSDTQSAAVDVGAYSLLSRKAVDSYIRIKDTHRHYLMILRLLGFPSTHIQIQHDERFEGKSSYNFLKLIKHAMNGITSQSDKLLRLSIGLGFTLFLVSLLWAAVIITQYFIRGAQPGYTSLMAFLLLSTGLILMSIGVAGIYIGKIFEQTKNRPLYFIDKKVNF